MKHKQDSNVAVNLDKTTPDPRWHPADPALACPICGEHHQ